ncbi:MAG TPA: glycosyltransferase family 2 protein [Candidatus Limnocylindrales bacterium]|nr:glycosyltransferase family 2 protein [Candidatus Limnocylindrales bacterium]
MSSSRETVDAVVKTTTANHSEEKGGSLLRLPSYVLVTPARNEEAFIEKTIESVTSQTLRPLKWVIVNDGSTDATAQIIGRFAALHDWIEVVTLPEHRDRSFAGKVHAFNAGWQRVRHLNYEVIGNLDADLSFDPDYFEFLIRKFEENPRLGVAGTIFRSEGYSSATDSFEGQNHVAGGCQLFRRQCFEEIGGYVPNKGGAIDWIAVTTARMKGWKTRSYQERSFFHFRPLGTAERSKLESSFYYGEKDYWTGSHPVWELFRVLYRSSRRPYILDGFALGSGYFWAMVRRVKKPISKELVAFYRREQMRKLSAILKSILTFKSIDKFKILSE